MINELIQKDNELHESSTKLKARMGEYFCYQINKLVTLSDASLATNLLEAYRRTPIFLSGFETKVLKFHEEKLEIACPVTPLEFKEEYNTRIKEVDCWDSALSYSPTEGWSVVEEAYGIKVNEHSVTINTHNSTCCEDPTTRALTSSDLARVSWEVEWLKH